MDANLLIDAIVRQTTVLIAQLATAAGVRAPLTHTANEVFMSLVAELRRQGLSAKLIADMFGVSLRTYHNQVRRLSEGNTVRGRSLWEAVLAYVRERDSVLRADVLAHFQRDDETLVRSVLKDLVGSGLVRQDGRGERATYRGARSDELAEVSAAERQPLLGLVWVAVYRAGPVSAQDLLRQVPVADSELLERALATLCADGRVLRSEVGGEPHYWSERCMIPVGAEEGWAGAVFDHYQAMVTAITTKLRTAGRASSQGEVVGGSTYSCDVWEGHPLRDEVLGFLAACRERGADLVRRVDAYNASHPRDEDTAMRVYAYVGQTVVPQQEREEENP